MTALSTIRVLCMEDDRGIARLFQKQLEREGCEVNLAHDGAEGLRMYDEGDYDVVTVDHDMPLLKGLDVIRDLSRREPATPIIMVTGAGDETIAVEAMKLGANDYIVKDVAGTYLELLPTIVKRVASQRRLEAELRASEERELLLRKQKDQSMTVLAGGVAHDLNNVLLGIKVGAELLLESLPVDGDYMPHCQRIVTGIVRTTELTKKLHAYARGAEIDPRSLDANRILRDTLKTVGHSFGLSIRIETSLAEDLWSVEGDSAQLGQVFLNLFVNGVEAMDGSGTLSVVTENVAREEWTCHSGDVMPAGDYAHVTVSDTGSGMDVETRQRLFDPFFTTKGIGRGLGLAATFGFVASHNGSISVESAVGAGTTFHVHLPRSHRVDQVEHDEPIGERPAETILLVQKEQETRDAIEIILELRGYRVISTHDAAGALQTYNEQRAGIDLVILDLDELSDNAGEMLASFTKLDPDVRLVVASGDSKSLARTLVNAQHGSAALLTKPYNGKDLLKTIRSILTSAEGE
jgi:two-component system cell cycle sensor histidine kinase/response regulator CckA